MKKASITICFIMLLWSCQSNDQKNNGNGNDTLLNLKYDTAAFLEYNRRLGLRALASLDSSARAALNNDWKRMELNGKVKSITIDICSLAKGKTEPEKPCKEHSVYNFNEFGFLITKQESTFDSSPQTQKYYYDSTGRHVIQIDKFCYEDYLCGRQFCKYDDRGNNVEVLYQQNGKDHGKYIYQYDENNRMVSMEGFALHSDGHRFTTWGQTYDDQGNAIYSISVHEGDTTITTHRYIYDKMNRVTEKVRNYNSSDLKFKEETKYKYDSHGRVVEEIEKSSAILRTSIFYDEQGNWIKKIRKYSKNPQPSVDERVIVYY